MERHFRIAPKGVWLLLPLLLLAANGCASLLATAFYRGNLAPADCNALEGKKVAVICTAAGGDFGPNPNAGPLSRQVGQLLATNVPEIKLVSQQKVDAWMDENDTSFLDYEEIGKGLKADMIVSIEIESLRLQDNQTMYKGQTSYRLKAIDVADGGREVYAPFTSPLIYPRISGVHTASVSLEEFRQKYLEVLAEDIAHHFYEHDLNQQIAIDTPDITRFR
ncbi:MAG: hypothetical protein KDA41_06895 [Planctomycetales bacterium]|nr:hypothetical protein [Planctomycetales bacterium]